MAAGMAAIRSAWLGGALATLSGCAWGEDGALYADVTSADGGVVVEVTAAGLWLRQRSEDAGLSLGWSRRTYLFPAEAPGLPASGRHFLTLSLPRESSVASDVRTWGLEVRAVAPELAISIGVIGRTVLARVGLDDSVAYAVEFDTRNPERTKFRRLDDIGREH